MQGCCAPRVRGIPLAVMSKVQKGPQDSQQSKGSSSVTARKPLRRPAVQTLSHALRLLGGPQLEPSPPSPAAPVPYNPTLPAIRPIPRASTTMSMTHRRSTRPPRHPLPHPSHHQQSSTVSRPDFNLPQVAGANLLGTSTRLRPLCPQPWTQLLQLLPHQIIVPRQLQAAPSYCQRLSTRL